MPTTRSLGESPIPYDPKLNQTLRRIESQQVRDNTNRVSLGDGPGQQPLLQVEAHNHTHVENHLGDALRMQPPEAPRLLDYYRGNIKIEDSYGPLVLTCLSPGHTFVVMSNMM